MNPRASQDDLTRWLDQATGSLRPEQAAPIRAELAAHFEDAVDDWMAQGLPPEDASRRALGDLGDPYAASCGFNDTHRGRQRYLVGMLASLLVLTFILGFSPLAYLQGLLGVEQSFVVDEYSTTERLFRIIGALLDGVLFAQVVIAFKQLITWRFNILSVDLPSRLIIGGFAINRIGIMISTLEPSFFTTGGDVMRGGMLAVNVGLLLLARRLFPINNGLMKGIAVTGGALSLVLPVTEILRQLGIVFFYLEWWAVLNFALWPLVSLAFLQAIITYRHQPFQTA